MNAIQSPEHKQSDEQYSVSFVFFNVRLNCSDQIQASPVVKKLPVTMSYIGAVRKKCKKKSKICQMLIITCKIAGQNLTLDKK